MRTQSGFTLIEALVTMVVVGLLVSMAVPSFKTVLQNDRLVTQANDLLAGLTYARSEAIETNSNVTMCASYDQTACNAASASWNTGWIICTEPSTVVNCAGSGVTIVQVHTALSGSNKLPNDANTDKIVFSSTGSVTTPTPPINFDVCDSRGNSFGRSVYIYPSGQARASPTVGKRLDGSSVTLC